LPPSSCLMNPKPFSSWKNLTTPDLMPSGKPAQPPGMGAAAFPAPRPQPPPSIKPQGAGQPQGPQPQPPGTGPATKPPFRAPGSCFAPPPLPLSPLLPFPPLPPFSPSPGSPLPPGAGPDPPATRMALGLPVRSFRPSSKVTLSPACSVPPITSVRRTKRSVLVPVGTMNPKPFAVSYFFTTPVKAMMVKITRSQSLQKQCPIKY